MAARAGTVRETLRQAARRLATFVDSPEVEAEILLGHLLGCSRSELYARGGEDPGAALALLQAMVDRRRAGEPLQYLTGHQGFRRLDLLVGPGVLVPRPETEMVVEHALARITGSASPVVVDVGTGSGAIALSVATERPDATVWATELSPAAAAWARRNLERVGAANATVVEGDLLDPLPSGLAGGVDLVVANPPYLSESELGLTAADVRDHEPAVATVSGPTGLEVPARVVEEAWPWLRPGGWIVMETWPGQAEALEELLRAAYEEVALHPDLAGSLRIAEGRRPGARPGAGPAGRISAGRNSTGREPAAGE
jgi:release factor glutamine methyltransferase